MDDKQLEWNEQALKVIESLEKEINDLRRAMHEAITEIYSQRTRIEELEKILNDPRNIVKHRLRKDPSETEE